MIELNDLQKKIMKTIKQLNGWYTKLYIFNYVKFDYAMNEQEFDSNFSALVEKEIIKVAVFTERTGIVYRG